MGDGVCTHHGFYGHHPGLWPALTAGDGCKEGPYREIALHSGV